MNFPLLLPLTVCVFLFSNGCGSRFTVKQTENGPRASADQSRTVEPGAELEAKVRRVIADELGIHEEEIGPDASFTDDLDANELDKVAVVIRLEAEFGLTIPDADAEKIKTVRDATNYITQHSGAPKTP
jgi:acyl carrier protein